MRIPGPLDSRANDAQDDSASGYLELSASPLSLVCALVALVALADLALRAAFGWKRGGTSWSTTCLSPHCAAGSRSRTT
jgi:hypothetical protein